MENYNSKSRKPSGVIAFEIGNDSIIVQFKSGETYSYTTQSAGSSNIEQMKSLATNQLGLSTFISKKKPKYSKKWLALK